MTKGLFAFLILGLVFHHAAAQEVFDPGGGITRVEFVAVEKEGRERPSRLGVRMSGFAGMGFPVMGAINDYIDWINDSFSGTLDRVETLRHYGVRLEYLVSKDFYAGIGHVWMDTDTSGEVTTIFGTYPFSIDLTAQGFEFSVTKTWRLVPGVLDLETSGLAGYYSSTYTEEENKLEVASGTDDEVVGFAAGVGVTWRLGPNLDLFLRTDYRWLEFDDYRDGGVPVTFVSPGNPPVETDFSGPMIAAGLGWRF